MIEAGAVIAVEYICVPKFGTQMLKKYNGLNETLLNCSFSLVDILTKKSTSALFLSQ
jgi:hypothetical protein